MKPEYIEQLKKAEADMQARRKSRFLHRQFSALVVHLDLPRDPTVPSRWLAEQHHLTGLYLHKSVRHVFEGYALAFEGEPTMEAVQAKQNPQDQRTQARADFETAAAAKKWDLQKYTNGDYVHTAIQQAWVGFCMAYRVDHNGA